MESLFKMREKPDTPNRRFKEVRRLFNKAKQETDIKHLTLAHQIPNQKELVEMTNYDPINFTRENSNSRNETSRKFLNKIKKKISKKFKNEIIEEQILEKKLINNSSLEQKKNEMENTIRALIGLYKETTKDSLHIPQTILVHLELTQPTNQTPSHAKGADILVHLVNIHETIQTIIELNGDSSANFSNKTHAYQTFASYTTKINDSDLDRKLNQILRLKRQIHNYLEEEMLNISNTSKAENLRKQYDIMTKKTHIFDNNKSRKMISRFPIKNWEEKQSLYQQAIDLLKTPQLKFDKLKEDSMEAIVTQTQSKPIDVKCSRPTIQPTQSNETSQQQT